MTSNLDFPKWGDAFPNRLLGAATLDRLRHNAYRLTLEGESYRAPTPLTGSPPRRPPSPRARSSRRNHDPRQPPKDAVVVTPTSDSNDTELSR